MIAREWDCSSCGIFDTLEDRSAELDARPCPECHASAPFTFSAPRVKSPAVSATRGATEKAPFREALDTRELGEGMPMSEWRAKRAGIHRDTRHRRIKEEAS